ncbi:MAG TPA: thioesterase family protein [Ramlibacter sp.]|jgi:acyl-CoA thioesterase|nr:thioesterase family protein [Ramlibacter sp.]
MMAQEHPFDAAIALQAAADGSFTGRTSAAYANMIGPYGGITAAQCIQAVLQHPQRLGDPVSLTINFAAALGDGSFIVRPRAARTNRSTQHWIVEMLQGDEVVATATVFTAVRRETWSGHEARMPQVPRPHDTPQTPRHGVEWLNRYEMRFLEGFIPKQWDGAERDDSLTRLWVRDNPARPLDFSSLTALADIFFPRVWLRRAKLVPIGTVSMTVYYHADAGHLRNAGQGYLLLQAQGQGFGGGYFDHGGQLWDEGGTLLATTHQVVYYKE